MCILGQGWKTGHIFFPKLQWADVSWSCFLQEFHHTCQEGMLRLCRSVRPFFKGDSVSPSLFLCVIFWCRHLVQLSQQHFCCSLFSGLIKKNPSLYQDRCQDVQRLGLYVVKPLPHILQQSRFCHLHSTICTKTLVP